MSTIIPPAKNYQSPLISIPARWQNMPTEGARYMVVDISWLTMGYLTGNNSCIAINTAGQGAQTISQIVALSVDNSQCGADIVFIFPDTAQTYTVPAYSPNTTFPVFTGQTQLYINALGVTSSDNTRMTIHNYMPPVLAVPVTNEQQFLGLGNINITGAGSTVLVAAPQNGTVEALSIGVAVPSATLAYNNLFQVRDGTGVTLATCNAAGALNSTQNGLILNLIDISPRFRSGLSLVQSGGFAPGGTLSVNLYYRVP